MAVIPPKDRMLVPRRRRHFAEKICGYLTIGDDIVLRNVVSEVLLVRNEDERFDPPTSGARYALRYGEPHFVAVEILKVWRYGPPAYER
jgi:hypothetical protein